MDLETWRQEHRFTGHPASGRSFLGSEVLFQYAPCLRSDYALSVQRGGLPWHAQPPAVIPLLTLIFPQMTSLGRWDGAWLGPRGGNNPASVAQYQGLCCLVCTFSSLEGKMHETLFLILEYLLPPTKRRQQVL